MPLEFELTRDDLRELPSHELVAMVLKLQVELQATHLKLALARVTIGEYHQSVKNKSNAVRNLLRQRKSLKQTVKRRRKYAK